MESAFGEESDASSWCEDLGDRACRASSPMMKERGRWEPLRFVAARWASSLTDEIAEIRLSISDLRLALSRLVRLSWLPEELVRRVRVGGRLGGKAGSGSPKGMMSWKREPLPTLESTCT